MRLSEKWPQMMARRHVSVLFICGLAWDGIKNGYARDAVGIAWVYFSPVGAGRASPKNGRT
ncbi:MAG: hypothetical protein J0H86_09990 [Xanthomonadaceae bacterium]|nr:hypothetical protein [Xanthomonadaceae bacterium]